MTWCYKKSSQCNMQYILHSVAIWAFNLYTVNLSNKNNLRNSWVLKWIVQKASSQRVKGVICVILWSFWAKCCNESVILSFCFSISFLFFFSYFLIYTITLTGCSNNNVLSMKYKDANGIRFPCACVLKCTCICIHVLKLLDKKRWCVYPSHMFGLGNWAMVLSG